VVERAFKMDTGRLSLGRVATKKTAGHKVAEVPEEESDSDDVLLATALPRVNGVAALVDSDEDGFGEEDEDSNDEWEIDSLFEDTLEEMGDEHLFEGGEHPMTIWGKAR
jgi:NAD-dependent histone deacetylase SIR2